MTAQVADVLWLEGRELRLHSNPLESLWSKERRRPQFIATTTAHWRGYVATWLIENGRLYLTAIDGWIASDAEGGVVSGPTDFMQETIRAGIAARSSRKMPVSLALLFPGAGDRVHAGWFTGVLCVPDGAIVEYVHQGYGSVFEHELHITIERRMVTNFEVLGPDEVLRRREERYRSCLDHPIPARPNARGWITCPHCFRIFRVSESECWDGERHKCGGRVSVEGADEE